METDSPQDAQSVTSTLQALQAALGAHYVLEREVGRGGMATVYRARDLRHDRPVAVKVLHPELAAILGAQRFLGEIRTTAALQHPHILPLFDSGEAAGQLYYVMPFVAGETLGQRLARERQLPVDEALRIMREVAGALDYAHRHGIIHRDIKPENILLGEDGQALVADFGIALAVRHAAGERLERLTQSGLLLGTPQYMAPEQAAGERVVDARADVYALGAVLHEMLAGQPPFTGTSAQAVIARLMTEAPPPLTHARRSVPPHVEAAVLRALEKLPADRFPTAGAFATALAEPTGSPTLVRPGIRSIRRRSRLAAGLIATGALVAGVAFGVGLDRKALTPALVSSPPEPVRFIIEPDSGSLGAGTPLILQSGAAAISPNGRIIVYVASGSGGSLLYVRRMDELTARPLGGTEGGDWPLFSPDGEWVAFYSKGSLWKIRLSGGAPVQVTQLSARDFFAGGCWLPGDTILFAGFAGALYRVPAAGGVATRVALAGTWHVRNPQPIPGRRAVLVTVTEELTEGRVGVLDLASRRVHQFGRGMAPHYVAGQIVYDTYEGELYRQPFSVDQLAPTGNPEQIASGLTGGAAFDVSRAGALIYRLGSQRNPDSTRLAVMDREGRVQRVFPVRKLTWMPRFATDGRRVIHGEVAPGRDSGDVWITDIVDGTTQRVTADEKDGNDAQWSPDGRSIAYTVNAPGGKDIVVQALDGGAVRRFPRPGIQWTSDWVRQGNVLLFTDLPQTGERAGDWDIWVQPLDGTPARPYLREPGHQWGARVSPDGHWAAYASDETGQFEVYVRSFPTPGRKTVVSAAGGMSPVWSPDGRELYYWQRDQLVVARLDAGAAGLPLVRSRTPLFRAPYVATINPDYDVSPDGTRFVLVIGPPRPDRLVVVLNALGADRAADGPARR